MDNNLNTIKIPISTFKEDNLALFFDKPFEHTVRYIECVPPKYFNNNDNYRNLFKFMGFLFLFYSTFNDLYSSKLYCVASITIRNF